MPTRPRASGCSRTSRTSPRPTRTRCPAAPRRSSSRSTAVKRVMSLSLAAATLLVASQDLPSRSLTAHAQGTTQIRSTADGKLLLTTGLPDRSVKVWLLSTGKVLHTLGRQAECFAIRPDGGLAAVGEAEGTTVWNLTT